MGLEVAPTRWQVRPNGLIFFPIRPYLVTQGGHQEWVSDEGGGRSANLITPTHLRRLVFSGVRPTLEASSIVPLTPDEVISKTFQPTRFAEGYNQDEVDDFLDEVVATLRSLNQEIDDLNAKLKASQAKVAELEAAPKPAAAPAPAPAVDVVKAAEAKAPVSEVAKVEVAPSPMPMADLAALSGGDGASGAAGMLLLAQRLHDEHVRNGENQRDQLVADARSRAEKMVRDAEETRVTTLSTLELERDELQDFIDSLRAHEQEYRTRMRSFLQAQLADLDTQQSLEPADTAGR